MWTSKFNKTELLKFINIDHNIFSSKLRQLTLINNLNLEEFSAIQIRKTFMLGKYNIRKFKVERGNEVNANSYVLAENVDIFKIHS